jgi:hypothetical protein
MKSSIPNIQDLIRISEENMIEDESHFVIMSLPYSNTDDMLGLLKLYVLNGFLPVEYAVSNEDRDPPKHGSDAKIEYPEFIEAYFIHKMTSNEIYFWYHDDEDSILGGLKRHKYWMYCSIQGWMDFALKSGNSLPLLLYAPDKVYDSNRPKTDMTMFQQVTSLRYNPDMIIRKSLYNITISINDKIYLCLPVTRYAMGMSKGLYYNYNQDKSFCGTFYYYEPQSTTYLTFNRYKIYRNKYEALKDLRLISYEFEKVELPLQEYNSDDDNEATLINFVESYYEHPEDYPENLKMTPIELYNTNDYNLNYMNVEFINDLPEKERYAANLLGLYAFEDTYDQEVCILAKQLSIDVIILTHMVGSHQIVMEVLDVRDRLKSFSSLAYPI